MPCIHLFPPPPPPRLGSDLLTGAAEGTGAAAGTCMANAVGARASGVGAEGNGAAEAMHVPGVRAVTTSSETEGNAESCNTLTLTQH